jgi:hypothetical protein
MEYGATDLSYRVGAIYHVKKHFLIGSSFSPAQEIGNSILGSGSPELPGFAQPVRNPMILNTGVGWIPNRFFSVGASIMAIGSTRDTALLRDQNIIVGEGTTFQPRVGASYILAEYHHLKISAAAGSYYETSRIAGESNRLHFTSALQANPYFLNLGIGVDHATKYDNFFISVGFDFVRGLRTFDIIPREPVPPLNGFFPKPLQMQSDGLPDGLTVGEKKIYSGPSAKDVSQIIENIPINVENKFRGLPPELPDGMKRSRMPHEKRARPKTQTKKKKPPKP